MDYQQLISAIAMASVIVIAKFVMDLLIASVWAAN